MNFKSTLTKQTVWTIVIDSQAPTLALNNLTRSFLNAHGQERKLQFPSCFLHYIIELVLIKTIGSKCTEMAASL